MNTSLAPTMYGFYNLTQLITYNSLKKSFLYKWNALHWLNVISHLFLHICFIVDGIVHFIWMRGCVNNYPHSVYGIYRYQFKKEKNHLYMISSLANTLCPPQQASSSSHKIQFIYFLLEACTHNLHTSCSSWGF